MAGPNGLRALVCLIVIISLSLDYTSGNVVQPTEIFSKSDLQTAESNSNSNPKVVGVKKHKNYEIVVYEYDDESGEGEKEKKYKEFSSDSSSGDADDNSIEVPVSQRTTPPSTTTTTTTTKAPSPKPTKNHFTVPPEPSNEEDPLEGSASDEVSVSVESLEKKEPPKPVSKPTSSPSAGSISNRKTTTTEKPQLPKPFRSTKAPAKKKSSDSDESSDEYDEEYDYYSDEDDSSSDNSYRGKKTDARILDTGLKGKKTPSSSKKPVPKRFGGRDEYSDEYDDDEYYDEKPTRKPASSSGKRTTTSRPGLRRPGSGRITPKPYFPLFYDSDEDEYDDDDDDNVTSTTRKPKRPRVNSRVDNIAIKISQNRRNKTRDGEEDNEAGDDEWGIDPSLTCTDPNGKKGICQEYARCSIFYQELMNDYDYEDPVDPADFKCKLPNQIGICCPLVLEEDVVTEEIQKRTRSKPMGKRKQKRRVINPQIRKLIRTNLNNSLDFGDYYLEDLEDIEHDLLSRSVQVTRNTPEFSHTRFFPASKRIRQISDIGLSLLQTSNDITERLQLTNEIGGQGLKNFKSSNIEALNDRCPFQRPCRTSKYRSADGSCNNLLKPKMGQSLTPLARILEPAYADGRWVPRTSVRGFELPSARLLSQSFIGDRDFPDNRYTLLVMQFGQLLDHDLTSVPVFTFANNSGINCCASGRFQPPDLRHPSCFPIEIPASDPFYSQFGQRCMNFVRSRMAPRIDCSLGYADQMNALTHWIDASNIYGSTDEQMRQLRLFQGGLLRFSELGDGKMLLPLRNVGGGVIDYRAGDDRVNEMTGLMIMHLIWFREHNRIAFELARINPQWNDEEIFQEARRILTAEYQHIIYNEWLPVIIGRKYMEKAGIVPLTKGYYKGYDPRIDASIANAFSVAAFRMGHTLVQGIVRLIDALGRDNEVSVISRNDENARTTRQPGQVDKWLRGMAQQPIQTYDPFVTRELNGRLFQGSNGAFGMDLSSLNIQRGRDHGVPGYNSYRELCQVGKRARTFDDFKDWIAPDTADRLALFYAHPDDVDLWIGGLNERPLPGALVGPTFACIIGDQFTRSKKGDRYFYDIADHSHSFSPEQLREIRKVTFARILCDNGDELEALQPAAFLQADFDLGEFSPFSNSLVDCQRSSRIPKMNLRLWEKEPTPVV